MKINTHYFLKEQTIIADWGYQNKSGYIYWRSNSLSRITLSSNLNDINITRNKINFNEPNKKLLHNESFKESPQGKIKRSLSTEKFLKLNFLLKKKSEENSKENLREFGTSTSTPHKSLVESQFEENPAENEKVFDSFILPEVKEFQMNSRNKILQSFRKDVDQIRK